MARPTRRPENQAKQLTPEVAEIIWTEYKKAYQDILNRNIQVFNIFRSKYHRRTEFNFLSAVEKVQKLIERVQTRPNGRTTRVLESLAGSTFLNKKSGPEKTRAMQVLEYLLSEATGEPIAELTAFRR